MQQSTASTNKNTVPQQVKKTLQEHDLVHTGDHLVVGVSGGPDSLCLLEVLLSLREEWGVEITAVHVNHGFRKETAEADQKFVEDHCRERGIDYRSFTFDCPKIAGENNWTPEEAGRNARYRAFETVCNKVAEQRNIQKENARKSIRIVVAHNRNDQVETILQRLIRGTGADGLSGMEYSRMGASGYPVIRPLLDVDREDIEEYCRQRDLSPRQDETNEETYYMRNKIRHELLPRLREEYSDGIDDALLRLARSAAEDRRYWQEKVERTLPKLLVNGKEWLLDREKLRRLPPALRHRVMRRVFSRLGLVQDLERTHVEQMNRLMEGDLSSGGIDLPHGYQFRISYGQCICQSPDWGGPRKQTNAAGEVPEGSLSVHLRGKAEKISKDIRPGSVELDAEAIWAKTEEGQRRAGEMDSVFKKHLELRTRRPGDWIRLPGGRKKIQDLFVDRKIPRERRDGLYLVAMGSEILWIPDFPGGGLCSAAYPVTEETSRILELAIDV